MNQKTRKLMMMQKTLHPGDNIDRVYVIRKEVARGLTSFQNSVDETIQRFEEYTHKKKKEAKRD